MRQIVFRISIVVMCHAATRVVYYDRASCGWARRVFWRRRGMCRVGDGLVPSGRRHYARSNDEGYAPGRDWSRIHREKVVSARDSAASCRRGRSWRRFWRSRRIRQSGASSCRRPNGIGEFIAAGEGKQCGNGVGSSRISGRPIIHCFVFRDLLAILPSFLDLWLQGVERFSSTFSWSSCFLPSIGL